jgi:hypothetical protein
MKGQGTPVQGKKIEWIFLVVSFQMSQKSGAQW